MAERPRRRKRLPADEGRRALLDAGRALAHEQPAAWPLEHVRVTEVARRAGVTAGAIYHYWDSQEEFREDLLDDLFSPARYPPSAVPGLFADLDEDGRPIEELVRLGADVAFDALRQTPELRLLMGMWAADDPDVNDRIAAQYRAVGARWATFYEEVFPTYGLEIRPPFTFAMMATLITALGEGLVVRSSVDPEAVPDDLAASGVDSVAGGQEPTWGLLAAAVLALLPAMSRRRGSGEDLWGLVDRLRRTGEQFERPDAGENGAR